MIIAIPVFLEIQKHASKGQHRHPVSLVAAIRWDYEYGLMSQANIGRKYAGKISLEAVRDICNGRTYKEVRARRGA